MTPPVTPAPGAQARRRKSTVTDRVFAAIPVLTIGLCVLVFYGIEAYLRKTPWVFSDEVEWTQISRAIESTGHAARRGDPIYFKTVYVFLLAPFWSIDSTTTAYAAIKYMNVVVMTLAAVPTYLLARMLLTRRTAAVVAVLSVSFPGMAYVTTIIPDPLAYTWCALCTWLIVRALASRRRRDIAIAVVGALGAVLVRQDRLSTISIAFAIAAFGLWLTGPRGRHLRRNWTCSDTLGAVVLGAGAFFLFNRVVLQHVSIWQTSTQHYKDRMIDLGFRAGLSFVIGLGVLPAIGGFTALRLPERRSDPVYRAFAAYAAATIFCMSLFTAVKAAYLSTVFSTLWEERNLIYLVPIMLIGTGLVFESKRLDWRVLAGSTALVLYIICFKQFQLSDPYFEAPGFGIAVVANESFGWTVSDLRIALVIVTGLSLAIVALRRHRAVAVIAAVVGIAWMLTSEIKMTEGLNSYSTEFVANSPKPLDWVDRATHGATTTYLGQAVLDMNGVWLTEFWNRSIKHVGSLDGTAGGPGPTVTPNILSPDGLMSGLDDSQYVLADNGVALQARVVARRKHYVLYARTGPWRLRDELQQVYSDGWVSGWSTYTYFAAGQHGDLRITLSRLGYSGDAPEGKAVITVGQVVLDRNEQPSIGRVEAKVTTTVENGKQHVVSIPVAHTPVRVVLRISPTFHASVSDPRDLGAQVGFRFVPR
ncbi:MAG: hypothetical protein WCH31_06195 [Actinomycetes bacterium]